MRFILKISGLSLSFSRIRYNGMHRSNQYKGQQYEQIRPLK